jgi:hypothetical protein
MLSETVRPPALRKRAPANRARLRVILATGESDSTFVALCSRFRRDKLEAWVTGASVPAYFEAREASQITKGALSIKGWG